MILKNKAIPTRDQSELIAHSTSSSFVGQQDGNVLDNTNDIQAEGVSSIQAQKRRPSKITIHRRYSIHFREEGVALGNLPDGDSTVIGMSPRRSIPRRCSLFVDDLSIANTNESDETYNEDIIMIKDLLANDVDISDDNLSPTENHCRAFAKKERSLSLAMNNSSRSSVTCARFISENPNTTTAVQTKHPCAEFWKEIQLSGVTSTLDSLPSASDNLANYFLMIRGNFCEAMVTSEKTRLIVEKMNKSLFTQMPQLRKYLERKAFKRSQPSKHILSRKHPRLSF